MPEDADPILSFLPPANPTGSPARVHVRWLIALLASVLVAGVGGVAAGIVYQEHRQQIDTAIGAAKAVARARPCTPADKPGTASTAEAGRRLTSEIIGVPSGAAPFRLRVQSPSQFIQVLYSNQREYATRLFQSICLRVAVERGWRDGTRSTSIWIWLLRFGSAADARSYVQLERSTDLSLPRHLEFAVSGVPGGVGVEDLTPDSAGDMVTWLHGYQGSVAIIVEVVGPRQLQPGESADAALLRAQDARL